MQDGNLRDVNISVIQEEEEASSDDEPLWQSQQRGHSDIELNMTAVSPPLQRAPSTQDIPGIRRVQQQAAQRATFIDALQQVGYKGQIPPAASDAVHRSAPQNSTAREALQRREEAMEVAFSEMMRALRR